MKTIDTYLPVFTGFYGTIFEPYEDLEIDHVNEERALKGLPSLEYSEFEFDYKGYMEAVGEAVCNYMQSELLTVFSGVEVSFQEIDSPREYNFRNDSVNCSIKISLDEVIAYIEEHKELFDAYANEHFSSRSGFVSFFSNNGDDWMQYLKDEERLETVLGSVLDFVCENEGITEEDMHYSCDHLSVEAMNYDELLEKK